MAKEKKQVQTYYLKKVNIEWLNQRAFDESTPGSRVTDDALLDEMIDKAREADKSPSPTKQKKSALALEPITA